jgi:hypothetical protein
VWKNSCVTLSVIATKEHISSGSNDGKSRQPLRPACELPHKGGYSRYIVLWRQQFAAIEMTVCHNTRGPDVAVLDEELYQLDGPPAFIGPYIKCVTPCITHKK